MSTREGITGAGAIYYPADPDLLKGVLASEGPKVYPDDTCPKCQAEGRHDSDSCFHRHWQSHKNTIGEK